MGGEGALRRVKNISLEKFHIFGIIKSKNKSVANFQRGGMPGEEEK